MGDGESTSCAQLLIQFYANQFETLQALEPWSVDVRVVLALSSSKFFVTFLTSEFSHCLVLKYYKSPLP